MPLSPNTTDTETSTTKSQPLDLILNDTLIGSGSFSEVRLAQNAQTQELLAAKITDLTKNRKYYNKEVTALLKIPNHPNIVPLVQYGEDGAMGYIFTEFVKGVSLEGYVKEKGNGVGIGEEESLEILLQLVNGIDTVHKAGFSHNDLKPDNVIYSPVIQTARLIDFGLSTPVDSEGNITDCCGSPEYMAPEVLVKSKRHNAFISDIWSLVLIFYFMIVGNLPWSEEQTLPELIEKIFAGKIAVPATVSIAARKLLSGMLQLAPKARWSLERVKEFILRTLEALRRKLKGVRVVKLYGFL